MDKITEKVRLDVYLWAIRMYKTRSQSNLAIVSGKARKADQDLKPSYNVSVGDVFQIRNSDRKMTIQVTQLISKRVQYAQAILHYADISTDLDKEFNANKMSSSFYTGKRLSKVGRPTKKDARDISEFLDNDE
jgi:ribosome-associated heat shock protein Hsp15